MKSRGRSIVLSKQHASIVAAGLNNEQSWTDYGTAISFKIKNTSKKPISFTTRDIIATSGGVNTVILDYNGIQNAMAQRQQNKEALAAVALLAGGIGAGLYAGSPHANAEVATALTQGRSSSRRRPQQAQPAPAPKSIFYPGRVLTRFLPI
jgi:hypothetical protein